MACYRRLLHDTSAARSGLQATSLSNLAEQPRKGATTLGDKVFMIMVQELRCELQGCVSMSYHTAAIMGGAICMSMKCPACSCRDIPAIDCYSRCKR